MFVMIRPDYAPERLGYRPSMTKNSCQLPVTGSERYYITGYIYYQREALVAWSSPTGYLATGNWATF
jgi:hypothetical protein